MRFFEGGGGESSRGGGRGTFLALWDYKYTGFTIKSYQLCRKVCQVLYRIILVYE